MLAWLYLFEDLRIGEESKITDKLHIKLLVLYIIHEYLLRLYS